MTTSSAASSSLAQPDYWWYRARSDLLQTVLLPHLGNPDRVLDVGSADGPSVSWMHGHGRRVALDMDFDALSAGDVCGSALQLPFRDHAFDVVAAFDVVEHCSPEEQALAELVRVLRPGGRLFLSVPAYQWAWTHFDVDAGHYRRYTRRRLSRAVRSAGMRIDRATYIFAGTLPLFSVERIARRLRPRAVSSGTTLPEVPPLLDRLLMSLCAADRRILERRNLPFGSSVVVAASKPEA
jgi:SAM-dependent methyltransferase